MSGAANLVRVVHRELDLPSSNRPRIPSDVRRRTPASSSRQVKRCLNTRHLRRLVRLVAGLPQRSIPSERPLYSNTIMFERRHSQPHITRSACSRLTEARPTASLRSCFEQHTTWSASRGKHACVPSRGIRDRMSFAADQHGSSTPLNGYPATLLALASSI